MTFRLRSTLPRTASFNFQYDLVRTYASITCYFLQHHSHDLQRVYYAYKLVNTFSICKRDTLCSREAHAHISDLAPPTKKTEQLDCTAALRGSFWGSERPTFPSACVCQCPALASDCHQQSPLNQGCLYVDYYACRIILILFPVLLTP